MRTEAEIRDAVGKLSGAGHGRPPNLGEDDIAVCMNPVMLDLLHWVLGEPSQFGFVVEASARIDRAARQ